jgi:hypothetical protein
MERIIAARVVPRAGRVIVIMTIFRDPKNPTRWCSRLTIYSEVARALDTHCQDTADIPCQPQVSEPAWQRVSFVL